MIRKLSSSLMFLLSRKSWQENFRRQCVFLLGIHLLLLFFVTASIANVEVVSILGYVEIRRQGNNYWEVAKKSMELSDEDLVRILLGEAHHLVFDRWAVARADAFDLAAVQRRAIQRAADQLMRALAGVGNPGQEKLAKDLAPSEKRRIVDGRTRSAKATNMSRQGVRQTENSAPPSLMTNHQVDFLLSTLAEDANNKVVRDLARSIVEDIPLKTNTSYPNRNIVCAQHLLEILLSNLNIKPSDNEQPQSPTKTLEIRQGDERTKFFSVSFDQIFSRTKFGSCNDLDVARLYLALLNAAGVEAKPQGDNNVPLFIVFNSSVPAGEAQSITVNKKLYSVENDTVWFPIQITPSTDNFIKAWYKGSELNTLFPKFEK